MQALEMEKIIGETNTTGGTGSKTETTPRRQNFKMRLGYPLARGAGEKAGDTNLLIKCVEYQAPEGGVSGLGLTGIAETGVVTGELKIQRWECSAWSNRKNRL